MLPTSPGIPWWGAVLLAGGLTTIGAIVDTHGGNDLGAMFKFLFVLGIVGAVLLVRNRALFTAAAQPPLIMVVIGGIALYFAQSGKHKSGLKQIALQVVIPLAKMFPMMVWTFVLVLLIAIARYYLSRHSHPFATGNHADAAKKPTRSQEAREQARARRAKTTTTARRSREKPAESAAVAAVGATAAATTAVPVAAAAATSRSDPARQDLPPAPGDRASRRRAASEYRDEPGRPRYDNPSRGERRDRTGDLPPRSRSAASRAGSRDGRRREAADRRPGDAPLPPARPADPAAYSARDMRELRDRESRGPRRDSYRGGERRRDEMGRPVPRRDAAQREPGAADRRAAQRPDRRPIERDIPENRAAAPRPADDVPSHPSPRVRYRD